MTNLSIGGDTFRVEVEGDATKPALLLSHSLGADLTLWDAQMPALLKAFRVIRYDSRGHGGSTVEGGIYSIAMLGRDVLGILDALEIERTHFVGVSMGGMVGQWLLANAPHRIERAVLANTAAKLGIPAIWNERIVKVLDKGMTAVAGDTIERWFGPDFIARQPEKVAAVRTVLESVSPKGYAACCAALRDLDLRGTLHGIAAPVLVVSGRHDLSVGEDTTRLLVDTIPGAKHLALDTRHISNVEEDAAFSKAIVGFLTAKLPAKAKRPVESGERAVSARPAATASRRVGTRRSTAARVPLAALAKAPAAKASASKTPARGVAAVTPTSKGKTAKAKISKVEPPKSKATGKATLAKTTLAATKLPKAKLAKTAQAKTASAKTPPAKAATSKATLRAAPAGRAKASTTPARAATAKPVQPAKVVKRVSAKSLKAMAASLAPKARADAKAAPRKGATPAASPKSSRGARNTVAAPVVTKARAVPAGKSKAAATKAVKAVNVGTKSAKSAIAVPASLSRTKAAKSSSAKPRAAKSNAAPPSVAKLNASKSNATKGKTPLSKVATKAKPGRRAS